MLIPGNLPESQRLLSELDQLSSIAWPATSPHRDTLLRLRQSATDAAFPGAILPYLVNRRTIYYAIGFTADDWRKLAPLLMASIGKTLTDFIGRGNQQFVDDPINTLLMQRQFFSAIPISVYAPKIQGELVLQKLAQLYQLVQEHGSLAHAMPRSTAQLLYDFWMGLNVGDRALAQSAMMQLHQTMRIDALNRLFLKVHFAATFQEWATLCAEPFFHDLCMTRRPPAVTDAMAAALYHTYIAHEEQNDDPSAALKMFRQHIQPRRGTLFTVCPAAVSPAAGKAFLLAALSTHSPDQALLAQLRAAATHWQPTESVFFHRLLALATLQEQFTTSVPTSSTTMYWQQVERARDARLPATFDQAKALLFAAQEIQQLDVFVLTMDYCNRLSPEDQARIRHTPYILRAWEEIHDIISSKRVPHNWCEWVELLPEMTASHAATLAERAADEWPIDDPRYNSDLAQLITALDAVPVAYQDQMLTALPALVRWIQNDPQWPNPIYQPLYVLLFDYMLISEERSTAMHQAIYHLFEGLLAIGSGSARYTQILDELTGVLGTLKGAKSIDWLIDLAELTVAYSCPDHETRYRFLNKILQEIAQFGSRLTEIHRAVLAEIAEIMGASTLLHTLPPLKESAPYPTSQVPKRFLIGIYTLVEQVGRSVVEQLQHLYPSIQVKVNNDKVNSPQLKELSRHANLMVVCWATAKHAATMAIGQERPKEKATLFPRGSGTSSILHEITEYLHTL